MFRRKKKNNEPKISLDTYTKFVIPQIAESNEGIRLRKPKFQKSEFASSIFGSGIKDESSYVDNAKEGIDVRKSYDSFRRPEDKKISEEELIAKHGSKFPEFYRISNETAKEVYGEQITVNKKKQTTSVKQPTVDFSFIEDKPQPIETSNPIVNEVNTDPEQYEARETNQTQKPAITGFSFGFDDLVENDQQDEKIKTFEPFIQIKENDEDDYFKKHDDKPQSFSNVFVRSDEEMKDIYNQTKDVSHRMENDYHEEHTFTSNQTENNNNYQYSEDTKPKAGLELPQSVNPYMNYILPPIDRFKRTDIEDLYIPEWVTEKKEVINQTLQSFDLAGEVVNFTKGPTFTRYEVLLSNGINVRKVVSLQDTFQANLGVTTIRIQAPIPGKRTVGIEVPNDKAQTVWFGDVITDEFVRDGNPLNVALGKDIDGKIITSDISKWPHGLVGGATNSGKSVCINTILVSLLLKNKPDDLRLILVDPKQVELITYNDLPHLITPVISDSKMASHALKWTVEEMERRYSAFAHSRSRNIADYNEKCKADPAMQKMCYIIVVIDELADLMQVCGSEVEDSIQRITQKARAAGIHLIVATQRPTVDVVKGTIKANIPARLAFRVFSQTDSFTILDEGGAESLLGKGDMLLKDGAQMVRLQGSYIPDKEIDYVTDYIKNESQPNYVFDHNDLKQKFESDSFGGIQNNSESPEMLYECAKYFIEIQSCSINMLQQRFKLGFNRANRIVTALEEMHIVSEKQNTKPREVLVTLEELDDIFEK